MVNDARADAILATLKAIVDDIVTCGMALRLPLVTVVVQWNTFRQIATQMKIHNGFRSCNVFVTMSPRKAYTYIHAQDMSNRIAPN